jgi:hypothetical protein
VRSFRFLTARLSSFCSYTSGFMGTDSDESAMNRAPLCTTKGLSNRLSLCSLVPASSWLACRCRCNNPIPVRFSGCQGTSERIRFDGAILSLLARFIARCYFERGDLHGALAFLRQGVRSEHGRIQIQTEGRGSLRCRAICAPGHRVAHTFRDAHQAGSGE